MLGTASDTPKYTETTEQIRITVHPAVIEKTSDPAGNTFAFSYSVKIENLGETTVQLLERHWIVMSADVQIAEIIGPGVVGEQPVLEAGQSFEYTSGAVIHDPIGAMHGSYTFRTQEGKFLSVKIPRFDLFYPILVH